MFREPCRGEEKLGDQPVSANIAAYYNPIRPDNTSTWQLRAELSLLFPER